MNLKYPVPALVVVLALAVTQGEALQCYQCNSLHDTTCNDPFYEEVTEAGSDEVKRVVKAEAQKHLKDCPSDGNEYTLCRKIYQTIRGKDSIIRTCGYEEYKTQCYKTVLEEYNTYVCACEGDGCNGSSALSTPFVSIILAVLGAYLFSK